MSDLCLQPFLLPRSIVTYASCHESRSCSWQRVVARRVGRIGGLLYITRSFRARQPPSRPSRDADLRSHGPVATIRIYQNIDAKTTHLDVETQPQREEMEHSTCTLPERTKAGRLTLPVEKPFVVFLYSPSPTSLAFLWILFFLFLFS